MGIFAKVDFIKTKNNKLQVKTDEEFIQKVSWSLGKLTKKEEIILKEYFNNRYKHKKEADYLTWAFISWEKVI